MTRLSGAVLTVITLLAMLYALGIFHIRLSNILSTKPNRQFHDRIGPTVLCVFLFGAYFLNFYSKFLVISSPVSHSQFFIVNGH